MPRAGILVRMPASLKGALVRETARRESNVNDVAAGLPRRLVRHRLRADRPRAQSASRLQPRHPAPRSAGAEGRDPGRGDPLGRQRERRHPRRARRGLGSPRSASPPAATTKGHHGQHERLEERRAREGEGARRDHRRGQLRQLAPPGSRVLQGRVQRGQRPRPHARRPRRLPHLGHRVRGRVRRRQGQGRRRPRRRHLGAPERHDQVRQGPEDRHQRLPRHDARRDRQVHVAGRREGARPDRRRRRHPARDRRRRRRELPPGRLRGGHEVVHGADPRRPAARW